MSAAVIRPAEQKPTLAIGEVLVDEADRTEFQVQALVGRGGMGEVYLAIRRSDGARCAVKCVRRDLVQNSTILLRTRFEALAFRKISHRHVVRVHGTGVRGDNVPWMAMEWLEGFTLAEIIETKGKIPMRWAIEIVRDLCRGLRAIHQYAIHRDVKPSNAHFGFDAVTRALDLGVAKSKETNVHLTSTGFQVGTLPFMAPEQLDNSIPTDHRADLWGAIIVLYMLMTGVHPFAVGGYLPQSKIKLGHRILEDPHRPLLDVLPSAPPFFGDIIDRGLAKDPERRHRSAEELAQMLTAALEYLERKAGHAEPLSSLVDVLRGDAKPVDDGGFAPAEPPPRRLWVPPGTTDPVPPTVPPAALEEGAPEQRALDPTLDAATTEEVSIDPFAGELPPQAIDESSDPEAEPETDAAAEADADADADADAEPEAEEPPGWLGTTSILGLPRWLVMMMSTSAVVTCQIFYFGLLRSTEPPLGPITVPVVSMPAAEGEREPAPAPPIASAPLRPVPTAMASATAAKATAAPSSLPRPTAAPRLRRTTPPPAPTSSTPEFRPLFDFKP